MKKLFLITTVLHLSLYCFAQQTSPCEKDSIYHHFNFWLGEWSVYSNDKQVGTNIVTKAKGGCAIHENYTTPGQYCGQSINYYNPLDKKWHQSWVGSAGDVMEFTEVAKSPSMLQFECERMKPDGQTYLSRMTFSQNEDGSVRQLIENSFDNRESWKVGFDGLYKKKK
ncbi:hypothetical protein [Fulvivirga ligni]|uniref:hypothetical protein n=1 Tax=Fulvivirga ligni TaxID=2904246 RepID=UPI001F1E10DC|nr:hypothetical protein [Fulvivirga ligni]UII20403.1 hypothetical protein LVD16_21410 [Fulvivirga ligni]